MHALFTRGRTNLLPAIAPGHDPVVVAGAVVVVVELDVSALTSVSVGLSGLPGAVTVVGVVVIVLLFVMINRYSKK